jgi:hypothetical protein
MYTQDVDSFAQTKPGWEGAGFTFDKYAAEIDAGRPVLISSRATQCSVSATRRAPRSSRSTKHMGHLAAFLRLGQRILGHGYDNGHHFATVIATGSVRKATYALLTSLAVLVVRPQAAHMRAGLTRVRSYYARTGVSAIDSPELPRMLDVLVITRASVEDAAEIVRLAEALLP